MITNYSVSFIMWFHKVEIQLSQTRRLSLDSVHSIGANQTHRVGISEECRCLIRKSENVVKLFAKERIPIYGVSTQFGDDAHRILIQGEDSEYDASLLRRQANLIRSLNCGMGTQVPDEIVRATLLIRANALIQGASGVRERLVKSILALLNANCLPQMLEFGSVGSSGDLIPLSTIGLAIMGEGAVRLNGETISAKDALRIIGLDPLKLHMKEGLSIVNGSSFSTAIASWSICRLCHLLPLSLATAAVCIEVMLGIKSSFHPFIHEVKGHPGQILVAEFIQECVAGSELMISLDEHRQESKDRMITGHHLTNGCQTNGCQMDVNNLPNPQERHVQDFYSLRCIPQGFGPFVEDLERAVKVIEREINSASDNPIVDIHAQNIHYGGNFMTDYVATICDQLRNNVAKASTWLHALMNNLVHPRKNQGLPANLMEDPEENSGFKMITILIASLAIHNRSQTLPVSAVMLPTEGDNQDMVSLGAHSAFSLKNVTENYARITACMCLAAAQAIEMRGVASGGQMAKAMHAFVRKHSTFLNQDRPLSAELEKLYEIVLNGQVDIVNAWFL